MYIANYTSQVIPMCVYIDPCTGFECPNGSHCKVIPMCLQILVLSLSVPLALNVKYLSQLVKHSVSHHVILTMEDVRMMKYAHWRM